MRIHVGGLPLDTNPDELKSRFSSFGNIESIEIIHSSKEQSLDSRGFGYIQFNDLSVSQWRKLQNTYNNSKWRGKILKLAEAKPNLAQKDKIGMWAPQPSDPAFPFPLSKKTIKKRKYVTVNENVNVPVTDKNIGVLKLAHWGKSRYGRVVRSMRTKFPGDRNAKIIDFTHHKEQITKLFGTCPPLRISQLAWKIPDDNDPTKFIIKDELLDCTKSSNSDETASYSPKLQLEDAESVNSNFTSVKNTKLDENHMFNSDLPLLSIDDQFRVDNVNNSPSSSVMSDEKGSTSFAKSASKTFVNMQSFRDIFSAPIEPKEKPSSIVANLEPRILEFKSSPQTKTAVNAQDFQKAEVSAVDYPCLDPTQYRFTSLSSRIMTRFDEEFWNPKRPLLMQYLKSKLKESKKFKKVES